MRVHIGGNAYNPSRIVIMDSNGRTAVNNPEWVSNRRDTLYVAISGGGLNDALNWLRTDMSEFRVRGHLKVVTILGMGHNDLTRKGPIVDKPDKVTDI